MEYAIDAVIEKAIPADPAIPRRALGGKLLHKLMQVARVVSSSPIGIALLVEPVEVDVPDTLVAQLPADSVCWLDCADFERGRGFDDGSERG